MKEITTLNSTNLDLIRYELAKTLAGLGLTPDIGCITYDDISIRVTVKGTLKRNDNNQPINAKYEEFKKYCRTKGIPLDWYGMTFKAKDGEVFKITGIMPRGRKNVLEILRLRDNSERICPASYVLASTILNKVIK